MNKLILTDVDGVVLDWFDPFVEWAEENYGILPKNNSSHSITKIYEVTPKFGNELVNEFNQSVAFENLPPYMDAVENIENLVTKGFSFVAITALGRNSVSHEMRKKNLAKIFGPKVFKDIIFSDPRVSKEGALFPYKNSGHFWVENKVENAVVGHELGLTSFIMDQSHNRTLQNPGITRVSNWTDISNYVAG